MNNLFTLSDEHIILHSGSSTYWKIDADSLTDDDLTCLAYLVNSKFKIGHVLGVPTGGLRFATYLDKVKNSLFGDTLLIVDDVYTTGNSMNKMRENSWKLADTLNMQIKGVVIFSRGRISWRDRRWITPIFQLHKSFLSNKM